MKAAWKSIGIGLIIAIGVSSLTLTAPAQNDQAEATEATHWEHAALTHESPTVQNAELSRKIVKMGEDGWELVTVTPVVSEGTTIQTVFYFKRPQ